MKDSQMHLKLKKSPYYMLDSSYTVASNPNTMRDTGVFRNAEYRVRDDLDSVLEKRTTASRQSAKSYVSTNNAKSIINELDKMKETMMSRCHHRRPESVTNRVGVTKTSGFSFLNPSTYNV